MYESSDKWLMTILTLVRPRKSYHGNVQNHVNGLPGIHGSKNHQPPTTLVLCSFRVVVNFSEAPGRRRCQQGGMPDTRRLKLAHTTTETRIWVAGSFDPEPIEASSSD